MPNNARQLLKETGTAITKQNHVLYEFEEWEAIDNAVAALETINTDLLQALRTIGWTLHDVPLDIRSIARRAIDNAKGE